MNFHAHYPCDNTNPRHVLSLDHYNTPSPRDCESPLSSHALEWTALGNLSSIPPEVTLLGFSN